MHAALADHPTPARAAMQRRTLRVLFGVQILSGAGLAAGVTVGALLAREMLGSDNLAGAATALFTIGSAGAALFVGRASQRFGRRVGLAGGYGVGATGALLVVLAAAISSVPLLLLALVLYGAGVATNLQARYSGADLATPSERGRAVSTVLVATTLGGVLGPNTVALTGDVAETLSLTPLAGPFMLAALAYGSAAIAVFAFLRPDPLLAARALAAHAAGRPDPQADPPAPAAAVPALAATNPAAGNPPSISATRPAGSSTPARSAHDAASLRLAAAAMILTQLVMVGVMTMTPVHMRMHHHSLSATGFVISAHIAAMFLPSPLTGRLVDRFGRRPLIASGGVTLALAGTMAALAPADSLALLTLALVLLGLGWNLALVGGTALLTDATSLDERARVQGNVDLGVALSGAAAGLGSGFMVAGTSFAALGVLGATLSLVLLPFLIGGARQRVATS